MTQAENFAAAVVARWRQALGYTIHIVFDRAHLTDAFGMSSNNRDATPKNLMTARGPGLQEGQRITINLDAEDMARIYVTIAHELGHAIGFNPTGIEAHGHFRNLDRYLEAEDEHGPKLLFDAYYFETLIRRLHA